MMPLIDIKTLVAADMTYNGRWLITLEMLVGVSGAVALAALLPASLPFTVCLIGIGCNYLLPSIYAVRFLQQNNYAAASYSIRTNPTERRRYNWQQWPLLLIPFLGFVVALTQSLRRIRVRNTG